MDPRHRLMAEKFHDYIPHARDLGMRVVDIGAGTTRLALDYRDELLGDPQRGLIHTGVVTTMIDSACGFAVIAAMEKPVTVATLDLRMDYLRPAVRDRTLYVHAECYRKTRHIAFVRAQAWQESEQRLVATSTSAFMLQERRSRSSRGTSP
jgi:uncharacterized protein (TIGR00369 family)